MSINPPLDIVLDVVKAADPARYKAAVERLTRLSTAAGAGFDSLIPAAAATPAALDGPTTTTASATPGKAPPSDAAKAYRGFEAMTLATFIESAMPDDSAAVFGSGTAGNVWKSMLAEQIANQMAKAGGIGLADQLAAFEKRAAGDKGAATPVGPTSSRESPFDPSLLVMTFERGFAGKLSTDGVKPGDDASSG